MDRNSILSGNSRQYISVTDCDLLEMIAQLLPLYKSFNRLANDALAYGLPKLIEDKFGEKTLNDEPNEQPTEKPTVQITEVVHDERIDEVVRLLQEVVMDTHISKSLVCSLFNAKCAELNGKPPSAVKFESGAMRDTPTCMTKYEIDRLNEMDGEDDDG